MADDARSPRRLTRPGTGQPPGRWMRAVDGEKPPVLDQPFDSDSLYAMRAAVAAHASGTGMPDGRVRDVVLVVHELASNVVRHGAGRGRVRLWVTGAAIRCEITDERAPHAGADGDVPDRADSDPAQWPVERGHGLWLVRQVADQLTLDSGPSGSVAAAHFRRGSPR